MKDSLTIIITFILLLTACQKKTTANSLSYINHIDRLELTAVGDEYGEWGGDQRKIIIYRDNFKTPLLADYIKITTYGKTGQKAVSTTFIKRLKLELFRAEGIA